MLRRGPGTAPTKRVSPLLFSGTGLATQSCRRYLPIPRPGLLASLLGGPRPYLIRPNHDLLVRMSRRPATKLFSWKKAVVIITVGIGAVSYRTYQSYQQKGLLTSVDFWAAAVTITLLISIVSVLGWWANR